MKRFLLALGTALALALPGTAAADLPACTTTVSSAAALQTAVSAAAPGDVVCAADGSYGALTLSQSKSGNVTVRAEHPGAARMTNLALSGDYITISQFEISDVRVNPGADNNTIDHNYIHGGGNLVDMASNIGMTKIVNLTISGNKMANPSGDAIFANNYINLRVLDNEITGVVENGNHNDCFQGFITGQGLTFTGNYEHDNLCQGFFIKDYPASDVVFSNNLFLRGDTAGSQSNVWDLTNFLMQKNTLWDGKSFLFRSGTCNNCVADHNVLNDLEQTDNTPFIEHDNLLGTTPFTFTPSPTTVVDPTPPFADPANDDYRLTDGSGRGVDWKPADKVFGPGGTSTPPPPPPDSDGDGVPDSADLCPGTPAGTQVDSTGCAVVTPPPADTVPVARYTWSPTNPRIGQTVAFDGRTSTCEDTPCQYHWQDDGADGPGGTNWPLGDGVTLNFVFREVGTKFVRLIVTDSDGDVASVEHNIAVRRSKSGATVLKRTWRHMRR